MWILGGCNHSVQNRRGYELGSQEENSEAEVRAQDVVFIRSVPQGLRWLGLCTPNLHSSWAVVYPGNGRDPGLCGPRLCAARTHSSGGSKAPQWGGLCSVPVPTTRGGT